MKVARSGLWAPAGIKDLQSGMDDVGSRIQDCLCLPYMERPISFPSNQPILNALKVFLQFIVAFLDDTAVIKMGCDTAG